MKIHGWIYALLFGLISVACSTEEALLNDGLIAYYAFDGDAKDQSESRSDGRIVEAKLTIDRLGTEDSAFEFDGRSYIEIDNTAPYDSLRAFTLAAWIYPKVLNRHNSILSKVTPSRDFDLKLEFDGRLNMHFAHLEPTLTYFHTTSPDSVLLDTWSHVAAVWDGQCVKLFHNGLLVKENEFSGHEPPWTGTIMGIGMMSRGEFFTGSIDEVRIYNRALRASEIRGLMQ